MTNYIKTNQTKINDFSDEVVSDNYDHGFVLTRIDKGVMDQIRSLRVVLEDFELNSENRRILRKTKGLDVETINLPIKEENYDFNIHKLGKEFYFQKNQEKVFTASKIKELVTDGEKSNFNKLLQFSFENETVGYSICYESENIFHYAFPFYELNHNLKNLGMGMILLALKYAIENNKQYFYLGSVHSEKSLYKLQFNNMEWWNSGAHNWETDIDKLKDIIHD